MPAVAHAPVGAPVWFDLSSSDPAISRAFYEGLFGWTAHDTPPDFGGYVNFYKGDAMIAGMMQNPGQGAPDGWTTYLKTDDAAATAEGITAAGGTVLFPPTDVMGLGTMAIALDPTGSVIGLWQPGTMAGYLATVGYVRRFRTLVASLAAATATTVTHGLNVANPADIIVQVSQAGIPIEVDISFTTVSAFTITSSVALANVTVLVLG